MLIVYCLLHRKLHDIETRVLPCLPSTKMATETVKRSIKFIGVREIFCQGGGAVNHLPKKFSEVAQMFTKRTVEKKQGPYYAKRHWPYWHMKVVRY